MFMRKKRRDARYMKQFAENMQSVDDCDLIALKEELLKDLCMTKKKSELISLEKRIEAIEHVQAARVAHAEVEHKGGKGARMKKACIAKFAVAALIAAAVCYVKINDIRFPDVVDKIADLQK